MAGHRVVALDNGGCTVKIGMADAPMPSVFPNAVARVKGERAALVGPDISSATDVSALTLRRPVDRGYVVDWQLQKEVWAKALRSLLQVQPSSCGLVLSEPYLALTAMREAALQVALQELGFASVVMLPPAVLSLRWHATANPGVPANAAGCALVVDCGFSFTHAVPIFDWRVLSSGVRRIDLGGKAMTNWMKEQVSYRSINLMDEFLLLEHIKDRLCFVSQDVAADLAASRGRSSKYKTEYVLPDGIHDTWGHVLGEQPGELDGSGGQQQQGGGGSGPGGGAAGANGAAGGPKGGARQTLLVVNNERFMTPEALFHPSDIGMEEAGLAEAIAEAVGACHPQLHALLWSNILLTGGVAACPGFRGRLEAELRPLVPDDYALGVHLPEDPASVAWRGAALIGTSADYRSLAVSRQQYLQHGAAACLARWSSS